MSLNRSDLREPADKTASRLLSNTCRKHQLIGIHAGGCWILPELCRKAGLLRTLVPGSQVVFANVSQ